MYCTHHGYKQQDSRVPWPYRGRRSQGPSKQSKMDISFQGACSSTSSSEICIIQNGPPHGRHRGSQESRLSSSVYSTGATKLENSSGFACSWRSVAGVTRLRLLCFWEGRTLASYGERRALMVGLARPRWMDDMILEGPDSQVVRWG